VDGRVRVIEAVAYILPAKALIKVTAGRIEMQFSKAHLSGTINNMLL